MESEKNLNLLPQSKQWHYSVFIILFAQMIALIGFISTSTITPFYIQMQFGITHSEKLKVWNGLLTGIPTFMLAIFAPIWGAMGDKYGKKIMLSRAILGGAISLGLMFFAKNIYHFFSFRILQGITTGSVAAANVFLLSVVPAKFSTLSLSLLQISIYIGMALGPLLGGYVFDTWGGRTNFLISSLFLFTAAIFIIFLTKEPHATKSNQVASIPKKNFFANFSILKNNPTIRFLITLMFFCQLVISLVSAQIALLVTDLSKNFHNVGSITGFLLTSKSIAGCLGALFLTKLTHKTNLHTALFISLFGMTICYISQSLSANLKFFYIFSISSALFAGGISPIFNTVLNSFALNEQRGIIFGISSSLSFIGAAIGPIFGSILAVILGPLGNRAVFFAGGVILLVVLFFAIKKFRKLNLII